MPDKLENVERERVSGPGLARFEAAVSARYGNEITFTQFVSRWQGLDGMPLALPSEPRLNVDTHQVNALFASSCVLPDSSRDHIGSQQEDPEHLTDHSVCVVSMCATSCMSVLRLRISALWLAPVAQEKWAGQT
ncbi:MAG TPA: hypothetical protein VGS27_03130 [Candidatus Sulfotelmatobacter sp.]|nr:hypothetical protein [Candidatus Sulfotelmatobacter sp.]